MEHTFTYKNEHGIDLLTIESPGDEVTRLKITSDIAAQNTEVMGISFLSSMLERGSRGYSKDAYVERLEFLGARVSIGSSDARVNVDITCRTVVLKDVLIIIEDVLKNPIFLQAEIQKLKKEYVQSLYEEKDDSRALSYGAFSRTLYSQNEIGYIFPIEARTESLNYIDKKTLVALHARMRSARWVVSMFADSATFTEIERMVSNVHIAAPLEILDSAPCSLARSYKELVLVPEKQNIEFFMGNRLQLKLGEESFLAFSFGIDVLGKRGGFAGRLMSTVREKEGLTYSIYAWIAGASTTRYGHWNIFTFFTPLDTPKGISSTLREVQSLVEKGVTNAEVIRFKELLLNQFSLAHGSHSSILNLYHASLVGGRTPDEVKEYPKKLLTITRAMVNSALQSNLDPRALVIVGAGATETIPEESLEHKTLRKKVTMAQ